MLRVAGPRPRVEWVPLARLGRPDARYAWKHMRTLFRDLRRKAGR